MALTLTDISYTLTTDLDDSRVQPGYEIAALTIRVGVVTDEGDPYVYIDVTIDGWNLTKQGARNKKNGYGPIYGIPYGFIGDETAPLYTELVGPALRDIILPRWNDIAGLPIEGVGQFGQWLAANPAGVTA